MRTLKLVVDINRTADGHIEGRIHAPGEPALPFSGRLELLRAIEDALPAAEQAALAPGLAGGQEGTRRSPRDQKYQARPVPQRTDLATGGDSNGYLCQLSAGLRSD